MILPVGNVEATVLPVGNVEATALDVKIDPVAVVFNKLKYSIVIKKTPVTILDGVSGSFEGGAMTAVMGTSGAGKTTLLDVIAGRTLAKGLLEGDLLLGGARPTDVVRKRYTGYCEQADTLIDVLSVRETLECTAELKCSEKHSRAAKRERVDEVLRELGLVEVAQSIVGGANLRGISGGQRKRVNIGCALITKPPILLLDEPTTGLDAATADDVLAVAAALARVGGRVVAATLHSPSSRAFRLFVDKLICLGTGGRVLYSAAPGEGADGSLARYLSSSCDAPFHFGDSLADHMVYVFGGGVGDGKQLRALAAKRGEIWTASAAGQAEAANAASAAAAASSTESDETAGAALSAIATGSLAWAPDDPRRFNAVATGGWHGVKTLLWYRSTRNFGDGEYIGARLGDKITFGLLLMSLFWGEAARARQDEHVSNLTAVLWFITILPGYGASAYMPQLSMERPVYLREVADGCYTPLTWLVSKLVEEFICILPCSLIFMGMVFPALGLQGNFLFTWLVYYLVSTIGITVAYCVAVYAPNLEAANALLPTYITINLVFVGYFPIYSDIPDAWRWYPRFNFMHHCWIAIMKDNLSEDQDYAGARSVLKYYDLERMPGKWESIGYAALFLPAFMLLTYKGLCDLVRK